MSDTIELLEAIGSDASLRYAATEELASLLAQARVSAEFMQAIVSGDGASLRQACEHSELTHVVVQTHATAFLDEE